MWILALRVFRIGFGARFFASNSLHYIRVLNYQSLSRSSLKMLNVDEFTWSWFIGDRTNRKIRRRLFTSSIKMKLGINCLFRSRA